MQEAAFLVAVQGIVGRIEIEDDLLRRCLVGLEEQSDQQALDRRRVVANLVVARGPGRRVLESVQRALAGERGASRTLRLELAGKGRQHRIVPQLVVVDEILVAERNAEHPLRHHPPDAVLNLRLDTIVLKAGRDSGHQADRPVGCAQQQTAGVRGHLAAVESGHHLAALDHFITEQVTATLCRHRGAPLRCDKSLSQKNYRPFRAPMHLSPVRNPG